MTKRRRTPPRPGLDDKRYKASRQRLKTIGTHTCHWCHWPIDMQLPHPHPLSWSCDHRVARAHLPADDVRMWHISNLAESHLRCNQSRGAKPLTPPSALATPAPEASIDW